MRQYELTVLIHPDLEMNLEPALDKVKKIVEDNGGVFTKEANEGKKRLSYPIEKQEFAIFYYYELDLPQKKGVVSKISDSLGIADEIIRFLLVKVDEERLKFEARRKARKESEEAEGEESEAEDADNKEE